MKMRAKTEVKVKKRVNQNIVFSCVFHAFCLDEEPTQVGSSGYKLTKGTQSLFMFKHMFTLSQVVRFMIHVYTCLDLSKALAVKQTGPCLSLLGCQASGGTLCAIALAASGPWHAMTSRMRVAVSF